VANVQRGYLDLDEMKLIEATEEEIEELRLRAGDLLFNEGGDRDKLGRGWVWQDALPECIHQNHVFRARLRDPEVEPKFVSWYANSQGAAYFSDQGKQTTNLASINLTRLSEFPLPLAPASEQRRIIANVEGQFTRLDAAVCSLRAALKRLNRYRSAVLATAFSGLDHQSVVPLGELGEVVGGLTKGQKRRSGTAVRPVPYLRVANVQRGYLDLREVKLIEATEEEISGLSLCPGDILLNEGGDRDKLGRGWIWRGELPLCVHQNHVFRVRLRPGVAYPEFISWYANSIGQKYFFAEGKHTTNLASISLTKLRAFPVPVIPIAVQERVLAEIDRRLSSEEALTRACEANLKRAERLRQAILKHAFEGRLVPQHPNDAPAAVLLQRARTQDKPNHGRRGAIVGK
jgi:type I restriction enzyme S subunit